LFIEFYNKENKLIKKLREEKIEIIDGQPTPMRIILEDLEENSETIMEFKEVKYSISLPDDFFTLRELEKGK
jgi:hypothetical protein